MKKKEVRRNRGTNKDTKYVENKKVKQQDISPTISIVTLNVNGLISTIKRQRLSDEWKDSTIYCLQEIHCIFKGTNRLKKKKRKDTQY